MKPSLSGFGFLLGYIVMVGVAFFLDKFSMKQFDEIMNWMKIGSALITIDSVTLLSWQGKRI